MPSVSELLCYTMPWGAIKQATQHQLECTEHNRHTLRVYLGGWGRKHTKNRDNLYQRVPERRTLKWDTKKEYVLSPAKRIHVPERPELAYNEENINSATLSWFFVFVPCRCRLRSISPGGIAMPSIDFCCGRCRIRTPRGRPTAIDKSPCFGVRAFPILNDSKLQNEYTSVRVGKIHKYY